MKRIVLGGLLLLAGCSRSATPRAETAGEKEKTPVAVVTVEEGVEAAVYQVAGTVRAGTSAALASQIVGAVQEVNAVAGSRVTAGQLLIRLDGREADAALTRAKVAVEEARLAGEESAHAIAAAEAQARLAQSTLARMASLFEKKSIAPQEFDEARARFQQAEEAVRIAQARRSQAEARMGQAEQAVQSAAAARSHTDLRAPFDALVVERRVEPGQVATPGTPLLIVERAGAYHLEAAVEETMLRQFGTGQRVSVALDALDVTLPATIAEIVPALDPASRTFLVKASLPPSPHLRTGLFGRLRMETGTRPSMRIPESAVVQRAGLESVLVADRGVARMRVITTGDRREGRVEALSGLRPGDRIITPRPEGLYDGAAIEVRP